MKPQKILILSFALLLSACAFDVLDKGLPLLKGKSIETAMDYLGTPDGQMNIAGNNVYVWDTNFSMTTTRPVTSYSNATAYGTYGGMATAYGSTTTYVPETHNYSCTIKATTDKKNIITRLEYEGNLGGCERYMSPVQRVIDDFAPVEVPQEQPPT